MSAGRPINPALVGMRIRLLAMPGDPAPIETGALGTVVPDVPGNPRFTQLVVK
jgi:hypothetical protein